MSETEEAVRFAAATDVGRHREHNEDNFLVDRKMSLFLVCDGMGGHAAGEVASAMAVRAFHEELKKEWELVDDYRKKRTGADRVSKREVLNILEFAVNRASSKVHAAATKDQSKRGMGTTLVGVVIVEKEAFIVHVGDSRLYLLRDDVIEQVTEDHNVYNELLKRKKMPREKIEQMAQKDALTRAVGVYEHAEPETLVLDLIAGDRLLLCSDGLSMYFDDDINALGKRLVAKDENEVVQDLITVANERGGRDNITTILLTIGDASKADVERAKRLHLKRDIMAKMDLFKPLNDREILRVLQVTDVLSRKDGELVMSEGERGDELFIVLRGKLKVSKGDSTITTLTPGQHVGEMALIRGQPRSADVTSDGPSELMVIRRAEFFEILRKEHQLAVKLLWQFTGVLADRLADTSRELGQAREELDADNITMEIFPDEDEDSRMTLVMPPPAPE